MDYPPYLAQFNQQLRRIGRNHQHIQVGLDQDPGFFLIGLAQLFPGGDGLIKARPQRTSARDTEAIAASAAEIGELPGLSRQQFGRAYAVRRLRDHERERVLPGACRSGKHHRLRQPSRGDALAQALYGRVVPDEIAETHNDEPSRSPGAAPARREWACQAAV